MAALSRALIALVLAGALHADEALPRRDPGEALNFEPNLRLYEVPEDSGPARPPDLGRAERNAERARQKEQRWKTLQRSGVVSQAEAERASRQAAEAVSKLAMARVTYWEEQVELLRAKVGKGGGARDLLVTAEQSLTNAQRLAADARTVFHRRSLEIAEANLERQQRLVALGIGSKAEVQRAAAAVEKWKQVAQEASGAR